MIDLSIERPITLKMASSIFPPGRNGKDRHISHFIRGITDGINGCKLEAVRDGSRWLTSREALQRWLDRQTVAALGASDADTTTAHRNTERAVRELAAVANI